MAPKHQVCPGATRRQAGSADSPESQLRVEQAAAFLGGQGQRQSQVR